MSKTIKITITILSIIILLTLAVLITGVIRPNPSDSDIITPETPTTVSTTTDTIVDEPTSTTTSIVATTTVRLPTSKPVIDLTTKVWKWADSQNKNYERFSLTFKKGNTVSITTDCNGMGGNYIQKGNNLSFVQMISTEMFCEGSSEQEFSNKIQSVKSFEIIDGKLILKYDGGALNFK